MKKNWLALIVMAACSLQANANELHGLPHRKDLGNRISAGDCSPATSSIDLNINNVRTKIQNGGDMWWDLVNNAKYEVPKVETGQTPANSLFAGAIWIGGIDQNNQLKVACQTYRQTGNDFFPGPLDGAGGTTTSDICSEFDRHWQVLGAEIDEVINLWEGSGGNPLSADAIPENILNWPARNNPYNTLVGSRNMAPFFDRDEDGSYDPTLGDYPIIGQSQSNVYADQMIWWVYNDNGNIHSETGGEAIGMEVQALAFAFKTSDEVNDMTFYKYRLLNKSLTTINNCFMGQWVDPDLGCYTDDYIGCDTVLGLGVVYNSDPIDEPCGAGGFYSNQPPLVGIDYFQGPLDENGNELGMSYFLYYNNDFTVTGNPEKTSDFYGYLSGKWKDGSPFTAGGNAYGGATPTKYVFPSEPNSNDGWSECSEQNTAADRRIVQSSGPFTLLPGATNDIVVGIVWVRPPVGTYAPCPNFDLLLKADNKAQALFESNFKILDGPAQPDVKIVELDRKLVLAIEGYTTTEAYSQADPVLKKLGIKDSLYKFEGYQIYQLKTSSVSLQELTDGSKAQLIYQCDIKNGVGKLVNYVYDAAIGDDVPVIKVDGADAGIRHSFEITANAFATGDKQLINHQTYYFAVVPYAYNGYVNIDTTGILFDENQDTVYQTITTNQKLPFLSSRSVTILKGIPHITTPEFAGMILNATFGDGPEIIRQEGKGNGGLFVDLTQESVNTILQNGFMANPKYVKSKGPVSVTVYDPKSVPNADFELMIKGGTVGTGDVMSDTSVWTLQLMDGETVVSEKSIEIGNEQLIPDWGLSVYISQVSEPQLNSEENYVVGWEFEVEDNSKSWLIGVPDVDGSPFFNWILSGNYSHSGTVEFNLTSDYSTTPVGGETEFEDPTQQFENIGNRTIAPYRLCSQNIYYGPILNNAAARSQNSLKDLPSIDLVFTPDKSKWSRCVVIETCPEIALSEGGVPKMAVRRGRSVDQNGVQSSDPTDLGMGWFPGYAIDPETGTRLNIMFGEDSWQIDQNGRDMIWNPTTEFFSNNGEISFGGRHWVYVLKTQYDECAYVRQQLTLPTTATSVPISAGLNVYKTVGWVSQPILESGKKLLPISQGLIPTETTFKVRISRPYERFQAGDVINETKPRYTFNTANIAAVKNDLETAKSALDTIKVIPNPYYAYSGYERNQVDNRIKIANLPKKCIVTIYSLDGTLIRRYDRDDDSSTSLEWDLKNIAGVPIASGLYLIHVNAEGIGEKTLKWFGITRPIDLDSF